jgi:hypothetical protein
MKKIKWVWIGILIVVIGGSIYLFSSSGMTGHTMDFAQAYLDKSLYENAIEKTKNNEKVKEIFGELEPIDKLAILEGDVVYSNDNKTVKMSVRIKGSKEKGTMHILANKENKNWKYEKINIISKKQKNKVNIIDNSEQ